jgi:hypothetical protein
VTRDKTIWLAGLLEGEACFHSTRSGALNPRLYPAIKVVMVDRDVIERVAACFRQFSRTGRCKVQIVQGRPVSDTGTAGTTYEATIVGWPAVDLMQEILPWMGERRTAKINELISDYKRSGARRRYLEAA